MAGWGAGKILYIYCKLLYMAGDMLSTLRARVRYWPFLRLGYGCKVESGVKFRAFLWAKTRLTVELKGLNTIGYYSVMQGSGNIVFGERSYCRAYCVFAANESISIGADVMIADAVTIRDTDHVTASIEVAMMRQGIVTKPVVIEDDVWIGHGATILKGVRVGRGSIIAAGAVVTRDVPAYSVAGGVPAKVLSSRGK